MAIPQRDDLRNGLPYLKDMSKILLLSIQNASYTKSLLFYQQLYMQLYAFLELDSQFLYFMVASKLAFTFVNIGLVNDIQILKIEQVK